MKKITLLLFLICSILGLSQEKSTGIVSLSTNVKANITLNNSTSLVTLSLTGPNDRWFALQFGSFANGDGMMAGADVVYWNGTTLVDGVQEGVGSQPTVDPINNWTLVSNTNNSPSTGLRTVVFSRPFNTGDANDYTFNYSDTTIDFVWARKNIAGYTIDYHGATNRGYGIGNQYTNLGVEDFSLNNTLIFPNPSSGKISIIYKTSLTKVNIYSQTGQLVRKIDIKDKSENVKLNVEGLENGVYLIELQNDSEKSWKKVIIN